MFKEVPYYISLKALADRRKRLMLIKFMSMLDEHGR